MNKIKKNELNVKVLQMPLLLLNETSLAEVDELNEWNKNRRGMLKMRNEGF